MDYYYLKKDLLKIISITESFLLSMELFHSPIISILSRPSIPHS